MTKDEARTLVDRIVSEFGRVNVKDPCCYPFSDNPDEWHVIWYFDVYGGYEYLLALINDLAIQIKKPADEIKNLANRMRRVAYHCRIRDAKGGKFINPDDVTSYIAENGEFKRMGEYFPNLLKWQESQDE